MKKLKLKKENLGAFLQRIRKRGELWGPRKKGEVYIYDRIDDLKGLVTEPVSTFLPIKKLFVPQHFHMLRFDTKACEEIHPSFEHRIIYGVPACEIHSLLILDRIFGYKYRDPYYCERREKSTIIALSCAPSTYCLCKSARTHVIEEGFDLAITDLDDWYLVWVGTSKGDDLIRLAPGLFDERITEKDIKKFISWREKRNTEFAESIDFILMPDLMDLNYSSPIWDEFAEKCLSCGACTMVCPTCNCYDVRDEIELGTNGVDRTRHWDSCMLKEYSMVAEGFNFREAKASRLKLWYTHKLQSFTGAYKKYSCVGCGRCIQTCPVDINVLTVAKALITGKVDTHSLNTGRNNG
jgi:sulfhydrogenase subunit beta (sulfur reductase)